MCIRGLSSLFLGYVFGRYSCFISGYEKGQGGFVSSLLAVSGQLVDLFMFQLVQIIYGCMRVCDFNVRYIALVF